MAFGAIQTFSRADFSVYVPEDTIPLLSLDPAPLPQRRKFLSVGRHHTTVPMWRATISLETTKASTCYQGEIDPFPTPGSLLTFLPFMQFGDEIENYLLLMNLEKNPEKRISKVNLYDIAEPIRLCGNFEVSNNSIFVVSFDGLSLGPESLPVLICRDMSYIPLFFSKTADGSFLSLEHTHPPASFVIHGKRWEAQKYLKKYWFEKLGQV